jgi:hypothetical protein
MTCGNMIFHQEFGHGLVGQTQRIRMVVESLFVLPLTFFLVCLLFLSFQGTYGTQGLGTSTTVPTGTYAAASWIDSEANLWIFGGMGRDSTMAIYG